MLEYSEQLDRAFHALADATRRRILEHLSRGPASVSDLAKPFDTSLSAIHQHVQVLEASGLVITEKRGRVRGCRISSEAVLRVENWLNERRQHWEGHFDRLGELLEGKETFDKADGTSQSCQGDKA
ncbi:ArsR/SmtB family transcription factor [Pseudaminobacter soli (ex Li et al. 2025)]|uniref:ArsR family transcriptional regulator n=1 Tax=Pseudaminobacter soli (ex Li et al. 2025) TaxID=1295366 RepID=A0A2P7S3W5_9HYPH|nr:metalloregulator ArsR/SmtB family transcription factor [Mesorhizobium soli]PSJ57147.1 ArsR family transcriptional regulator [Mesorhizobium soli]